MSRKEVIDKTLGEIRTFLDEVSNGTSHYRSLHNLTEQVEHQYHGRFLVELIQNAHDALVERDDGNKMRQRIEIVIAENEHPHGALYIANDGQPFTQSNFKAISNLGQSDKDPQVSIGNKGIGFRSVLEITDSPEIFSRKDSDSPEFDGYCFRFNPNVIQIFKDPIQRIIEGEKNVKSPMSDELLLRWGQSRFEDFQNQCNSFEDDWLEQEMAFLSPYMLPIPMDSDNMTAMTNSFQNRNFSTVIRLPFLSKQKRKSTKKKMERMDGSNIIFLQRLDKLKLVYGDIEKCYYKKQKLRKADKAGGCELKINSVELDSEKSSSNSVSRYWLWTRKIGGEINPEEREKIKIAVKNLPGKWSTVEEATIAIAVRIGKLPENGLLNIYLPTNVSSGCSAHFSAPFYGEMSRTNINFNEPFNQLLFKVIAEKSADIILESMARNGEDEATAIIDLLSPLNSDEGEYWWDKLTAVFSKRHVAIENEKIVLSDKGWSSLINCKFLPKTKSGTVVDAAILRSEATYPTFVESLLKRKSGIERIFEKIDISPQALAEDNAATVEKIAGKLIRCTEPVNWNEFWSDVETIFNGDAKPLIGRKVILGTDNQLHAHDENSSVFFRPRRTGIDGEVKEEGNIDEIPKNLRLYIAFLNESIQTHVPREAGGVDTTPVHTFLQSGRLVETYGVERIFGSVLVKATPKNSVELDGQNSGLCRDILQWSLRLLTVSKSSMDEPIRLLGRIRAPCTGGWYPIEETSFGPGWTGRHGEELKKYLQKAGTDECKAAIDRLLLPPNHKLWGEIAESSANLLERAGTFTGIRLMPISTEDWRATFTIAKWRGVVLPEQGPLSYSPDMWNRYRQFVGEDQSAYFIGEYRYRIENLYGLLGFEKLERFGNKTRDLLMRLILISLPSWDRKWSNWRQVTLRKIGGERHHLTPISPLHFSLREYEWMQGSLDGVNCRFRPQDRWYIPSPASPGGLHQFLHLKPLPPSVTSILNGNSELVRSLKNLALPVYDADRESNDPRLLNDLASALGDSPESISNQSVFLGQIRTAWNNFYPDEESEFPERVIVQNGKGPLEVISPSDESAIYLPDVKEAVRKGLELHSKPVLVMETNAAKRLREKIKSAYGDGVRFASELKIKQLVDGEEWQENESAVQLSEEFEWIIPLTLSVFAFSMPHSRGTDTKSFIEAMDKLRRTKISWVGELEVGLWHDSQRVATSPVSSLWLPKFDTLLAVNDARTEFSLLSEALASIVDRNDIETSLKLVLGYCERNEEVSDEFISLTLKELHISTDKYQEVQQTWLGNIAWRIRLARPVILLFHPNSDTSLLDEVSTEEQFQAALGSFTYSTLDTETVNSIVKNANGFKLAGNQFWELLGEQAQLSNWNEALSQSGVSKIINEQAEVEFQSHVSSIVNLLNSIIRWAMRTKPGLGTFKELNKSLLEIDCPSEYREIYWVVEFQHVFKEVISVIKGWRLNHSVIDKLINSKSAEDLREKLEKLGLEPDLDPIQIHADNKVKFFSILEEVKKVAIAWCLKNSADVGNWGKDDTIFETQLVGELSSSAYIHTWDDEKCFHILRKLNRSSAQKDLWDAIDTASSVNELKNSLKISEAEVKKAHKKLEQYKQKQTREKMKVKICGSEFVNSEDNLGSLWDHICSSIDTNNVPTLGLDHLVDLEDQESTRIHRPRGWNPTGNKKSMGRLSRSMENLIGFVGEIHAFRSLMKFYGDNIVTPSDWISAYSLHLYPGNTSVDDGFGCDFVVRLDNGNERYIEVKATQGDNEVLELGPSEVELALDVANRRKKEFVILHVLNALSENPIFRLLPNPYSKKFKSKYRFEEAGLRVKYKV